MESDVVPLARAPRDVWTDAVRRLDRPQTAVPLFIGLALLLRLHNLGESLWFDEVAYSTHFRSPDVDRLWAFILRIPGPPLYPLFAYVWASLFGEHELVVRLPSLICGLASIALTYVIALTLAGRAAAVLAALFLCFSPVHVWYSQEATPYAMTMALLLLAVLAWTRVTSPPFPGGAFVLYAGILVAMVFTHYYAAPFLLSFTLLGLMAPAPARGRLLAANAAVALALVGWLGARQLGGSLPPAPGFLRAFTGLEWWMLFFHWFLHGNSIWTVSASRASIGYLLGEPGLLLAQLTFAVLVVRGLWPAGQGARGPAWAVALFLLALPLVLYLATTVTRRELYIERYLILCLPFYAIAVAKGATGFTSTPLRVAATAAVLMMSAASYASFVYKDTIWTVYKPNPDWRSAVASLRAETDDPDGLVLFGTVPLDDFAYYLRRQWPQAPRSVRRFEAGEFERSWSDARTTRVVLIRNRYMPGGSTRALERIRRSGRTRAESIRSFKGVDLYTFVRR